MAALSESTAYFDARAAEYNVPDSLMRPLRAAGVTTLGHLAFALSRPGQEFSEQRFTDWMTNLNGGVPPTLGAAAAMRRLHFESEVVLTAALRASVEQPQPEGSTPKPLPYAERTARVETLQRTLPGLNLQGTHEPSMALVDECVHQYESRTLRYLEPARCNSRETEVMTAKTDKKLRLDTNSLAIKESKSMPEEDVGSAYKLHLCLRRRAVAYELSGLISFRVHEQYNELLLKRLGTDPPPGYQATSISQILRADKEVFVHLSQTVRNIRPDANEVRPLDAALLDSLQDYSVAFHLVPLPASSSSSGANSGGYGPAKTYNDDSGGQKGRPYGKSRGKGKKGTGGSAQAPKAYKGCVGRDNRNRPLCFNWNLGTCDKAPAGGSCDKGRHACFKLGCFKPHRFCEVHKADMPNAE